MKLDELRIKIDTIDDEIVRLINKRCKLAADIGSWKKSRAHAIYVPEREKQLFERLNAKNKGPISYSALKSIYREIISGAIALEKPLKIAYMDTKENSFNAARETFGDSAEYINFKSYTKLMSELLSDNIDYGVILIEDKSGNISNVAFSELSEHKNIKICAERIGTIGNSGERFFIVGTQETAPSTEDRTVITIQTSKNSDYLLNDVKQILKHREIFTAEELKTEKNRKKVFFVEFQGHPADKEIEETMELINKKIGNVHLLGGFPVMHAGT